MATYDSRTYQFLLLFFVTDLSIPFVICIGSYSSLFRIVYIKHTKSLGGNKKNGNYFFKPSNAKIEVVYVSWDIF